MKTLHYTRGTYECYHRTFFMVVKIHIILELEQTLLRFTRQCLSKLMNLELNQTFRRFWYIIEFLFNTKFV